MGRQPGHALVITQWKPELALSSDPTLLNLTVPETTPTVEDIWQGEPFYPCAETQLPDHRLFRIPTMVPYQYVASV